MLIFKKAYGVLIRCCKIQDTYAETAGMRLQALRYRPVKGTRKEKLQKGRTIESSRQAAGNSIGSMYIKRYARSIMKSACLHMQQEMKSEIHL